jgi:large subunit ribosomal protein L10|tara:strand:+ start:236 stop:1261 length:1026 start_codon:yes stop_codon:yes gene_type:complete
MTNVSKAKFEEVDRNASLIADYPVLGIANIHGIPAKQLQKMRNLLRENVLIKISKKSLIKYSLEKISKDEKSISDLANHISGQPAFIFSRIDPFKLYKILEQNRTTAPAKPNSIAPKDITIKKGETSFPPGPLLGELQQVGIPTTIQKGKIAIKKDTVVVKAGEVISSELSMALSRLGIEPMELGIKLLAAYEDGTIYPDKNLFIDEEKIFADFQRSYNNALNLCLESGYVTNSIVHLSIIKCVNNAIALAQNAIIFEKDVMGYLLSKAYLQMLSLSSTLTDDFIDDDLKVKLSLKSDVKNDSLSESDLSVDLTKSEEKKDEKSEEKPEDEAISGLGSLFD